MKQDLKFETIKLDSIELVFKNFDGETRTMKVNLNALDSETIEKLLNNGKREKQFVEKHPQQS